MRKNTMKAKLRVHLVLGTTALIVAMSASAQPAPASTISTNTEAGPAGRN
jgi:hypothetical protein